MVTPRSVQILWLATCLAGGDGSSAAPAEIRATWLTTTANDALSSPRQTASTMRRLREIGLNTVYVEAWKNGYTQFPSQILQRTVGVDRRPALMPQDPSDAQPRHAEPGRDLVQETLIEAHRNGLIYVAWFEYGFMAAHRDTQNHLRRRHPQWLTTTRDGRTVGDQNPFVWMNPLRPQCREFLLQIVLEAVDRYDLDGVQLDDRIAWPVTMGYDDYTRRVYAEEHAGRPPPDDPRDPDWIRWRAAKVTEFAGRFFVELKRKRPNLLVSISPAVFPWSLENYACDWPAWAERQWMDEFVPQVYRQDFASFQASWNDQLRAARGRGHDLVAGIRVVGAGPDTPWIEVQRKIALTRESRAAGHSLWFSRGVLSVYPEKFEAFYDVKRHGRAFHPHLPASWRPRPVVATRSGPQAWVASIETAGFYRTIMRRGGAWHLVGSGHHDIGAVTIQVREPADAVELLVDRRGAAAPQERAAGNEENGG